MVAVTYVVGISGLVYLGEGGAGGLFLLYFVGMGCVVLGMSDLCLFGTNRIRCREGLFYFFLSRIEL